jgi:hypothetical protein
LAALKAGSVLAVAVKFYLKVAEVLLGDAEKPV